MADEALFADSGSYEAIELRKLVAATLRSSGVGGIVSGMAVTQGSGLNVTIGQGFFVINDSNGGSYLGYVTTAQSVSISGNTTGAVRTDTIYATINPTTGAVSFNKITGAGAPPAGSLALATVAVPHNAVNLASAVITPVPGMVESGAYGLARFLRNDIPQTLYPGTNAYPPNNPNAVAPANYVQDFANQAVAASLGKVDVNSTSQLWPPGTGTPAYPKLIIQGGTHVNAAGGGSLNGQFYARVFPHAVISLVISNGDDYSNPGWTMNVVRSDQNGFTYVTRDAVGNGVWAGAGHRLNYIAIGW